MNPRRLLALCALGLLLPSCGCAKGGAGASPAPQGGLGQDVGDIAYDLKIVRSAQGAANEVLRASGDCDAVKAALPGAQAALDDALSKVRTGMSRTTLARLKKQISDVAGACP